MSRFFGLLTLVVGGIVVADILIHPTGTAAAAGGITSTTKPLVNALLGQPTK